MRRLLGAADGIGFVSVEGQRLSHSVQGGIFLISVQRVPASKIWQRRKDALGSLSLHATVQSAEKLQNQTHTHPSPSFLFSTMEPDAETFYRAPKRSAFFKKKQKNPHHNIKYCLLELLSWVFSRSTRWLGGILSAADSSSLRSKLKESRGRIPPL